MLPTNQNREVQRRQLIGRQDTTETTDIPTKTKVGHGVQKINIIHMLGSTTQGIAQLNRLSYPREPLQQFRQ